jgi:hypothetical protein
MDLCVTRVGEERPFLVGAIGGRDVAIAGVGREIEDVIAVAAGRGTTASAACLTISPVTRLRVMMPLAWPVDQDKIEHLSLRKHCDGVWRQSA